VSFTAKGDDTRSLQGDRSSRSPEDDGSPVSARPGWAESSKVVAGGASQVDGGASQVAGEASPYIQEVAFFAPVRAGEAALIRLHATLYLPAPSAGPGPVEVPLKRSPGLIVAHGAGSRAARHGEFCLRAVQRGLVVLALDFRGHGDSDGEADGPLEQDVLAAAAFLRDRPEVDPDALAYRGSSMGGFYGLRAAASGLPGLRALVLLCPASETLFLDALDRGDEFNDEARWDTGALRSYFEQQDTAALAGEVQCPVLLVHARGDDVVPFEQSLLLARRLAGEATLLALPGGTHTSAQHDPGIHRRTLDWLEDRLV
jgi:uncharacterized protein